MKKMLLNHKVTGFLLLFLFANISITAREVETKGMQKTPFSFIENRGQITDQHYQERKDVQFKLQTNSVAIFIGNGAIHYQWSRLSNPEEVNAKPQNPWNQSAAVDDGSDFSTPTAKYDAYRMDVVLLGANPNATLIKQEQQDYYEQYYLASTTAKARSFNRVVYQNIYPNIDWVLYTNDDGLKYDFVVRPGGNINDIKIQYKGAKELSIKDGAIIAKNDFGSITEAAPLSYMQEGNTVASAYTLEKDIISFDVAKYDAQATLIIDPSLEWATYYGSTSADYSYALVADSAGNVYMAGSTYNSSNIVTVGSYQTSYAGNKDAMVVKFTEAGIRIWATYYGGTGEDDFFSATTDDSHNIYLAGLTGSTSGMTTVGAHQTTYGGGSSDCFLVKMTPSGGRLWATYFGGAGNEKTNVEYQVFVGCDSSNNLYMVGNTRSTTGIASSGAHQNTNGGNIDGFVAKFNTNGVRQWATYIGGADNDNMRKLAFDNAGNVFVAGEMRSGGKATTGAHQTAIGGNNDAYLIKFNSSGVEQWATYYGGSGSDSPQGLSLDYSGSYIFMSGSTNSQSGIVTSGAHSTSLNGGNNASASDAFLVKFTNAGVRLWGTYFGGAAVDHSGDLIIDGAGNPGFTGTTSSTSGIATATAHQQTSGGNSNFDAMFVIFTQAGTLSWASYYGGGSQDYGYGINNAAQNIIYITGFTSSTNNIALSGHQNTMAGASDAFLAKFTPDTTSFIFQPFTDTVHCVEDTFTVQYGVTSKFYNNNTFTVQLSDASGNFSSPVNIGTRTDSIGGNILCTIPSNTTGGSGYRIRIVGTAPVDTSFDNGNTIDIKPKPVKPIATTNSPACDNDTLKLYANSTTPGVSYLWTGPFSFFSGQQNPIRTNIVTAYSGNYIVTANLNGCTRADTAVATIVHAANTPTVTANTPVCGGDSIKLSVSSTSAGVTYSWTGPGGYTSTSATPAIPNATTGMSGTYIGSALLNGCTSSASVNVTVIPKITFSPSILVTPGTTVCPTTDLVFNVNNVPSGSTIYSWSGPNGFSSNLSNPTRYNSQKVDSGYYKVTVTKNACSIEEDSVFVAITDTITAPNITSNSPVCEGDTLSIIVTSIYSNPNYVITEANGQINSGVQNITYSKATMANNGRHTVVLTVNGCTAYDTTFVTIKPTPPSPTVINNGPVCEGQTVQLTGTTGVGGVSFDWMGPNGFSSTIAKPTVSNITAAGGGIYTLRTILNGCKSDPASTTVVVNNNPKPNVSSNTPVCENAAINFTNTGGAVGTTYTWTGPGGFTSNGTEPIRNNAKTADGGNYVVTAKTAEGCEGKDTTYVEVVKLPEQPKISTNSPVCEEDELILREEANSATDITYTWTGPNNFSTTGKITSLNPVQALATGRYFVAAGRRGCILTDSADVFIKPKPLTPKPLSNAPITLGQEIFLSLDNEQPNTTYTWTGPGGLNVDGTTASIPKAITSSEGTYTITATLNGCTSLATIYVDVLPIKPNEDDLILYPNPNHGRFRVRGELTFDQKLSMEVINSLGMVVHKEETESVNKQVDHEIVVEGYLASGVYFFRTNINGKNITIKFTLY
ncbi:MAG: SBBP repeat-containing protein [Flavipsychrobacter sp.]